MANLTETATFDSVVYQLETTDPVLGGPTGVANRQAKALANRTTYLKEHMDALETNFAKLAPLNNPEFTGAVKAPTPTLGDRSKLVPTTEFVQDTITGLLIKDISGAAGATLTQVECGSGVLSFTGTLTANVAVIVPAVRRKWVVSNNTTGAFSLTLKTAAGAGQVITQGRTRLLWCDTAAVYAAITDLPSVDLTGVPTTASVAAGDNSGKIAPTSFVTNATDGMASINVGGNAAVPLTPAQYGCAILNLTGTLTGNINLVFPGLTGQWVIANNTTGAFNITAKTANGAGVVLPSGAAVLVWSDGVTLSLASTAGQSSFRIQTFSPAAGTTTLPIVGGFSPSNVIIEKNKQWMKPTEFNSLASPNITLSTASAAGDTYTVHIFASFAVTNALLRTGDDMLGPLNLVTPDRFDHSRKAVSSEWVNSAGMQMTRRNGIAISGTMNLGPELMGGWGEMQTQGCTGVLPLLSSVPVGATFTFRCVTSAARIQASGADAIFSMANRSYMDLARGEYVTVVCNSNAWYTIMHGKRTDVGMMSLFPGPNAPIGWIKVNGVLLARNVYADLFEYGVAQGLVSEADYMNGYWGRFSEGDRSTNFRIPESRGAFVRIWDDGRGLDGGRPWGFYQDTTNLAHTHSVNDGTHGHAVADPGHAHGAYTDVQGAHNHGYPVAQRADDGDRGTSSSSFSLDTPVGLPTDGAHGHAVTVNAASANIGIYAATSNISVNASGDGESRPRNIAWPLFIKI